MGFLQTGVLSDLNGSLEVNLKYHDDPFGLIKTGLYPKEMRNLKDGLNFTRHICIFIQKMVLFFNTL